MAASSVCGRWSTEGWPTYHPKSGLLKVEAVGTGFLMVSREAVLKMFAAYPELKIDDWNVARSERPHLYDLFKDLYYDDPELEFGGRRRDGEDFSFCHRWRAIGGECSSIRTPRWFTATGRRRPRAVCGSRSRTMSRRRWGKRREHGSAVIRGDCGAQAAGRSAGSMAVIVFGVDIDLRRGGRFVRAGLPADPHSDWESTQRSRG